MSHLLLHLMDGGFGGLYTAYGWSQFTVDGA
jgi:hypothetical protein